MAGNNKAFRVGLFVMVGLVLAIIALVWLGISDWFREKKTYVTYFDVSVQGLNVDSQVKFRGVQAVLADPAKGEYWLAELDGQVVGCLLLLPEWSDWRNGTVLWIHSVYVRPEYRRRGVFRRLYEHVKAMVEADDYLKGLRLYVDRNNTAAKRAYEALGMDGQHYQVYEWMK